MGNNQAERGRKSREKGRRGQRAVWRGKVERKVITPARATISNMSIKQNIMKFPRTKGRCGKRPEEIRTEEREEQEKSRRGSAIAEHVIRIIP